ncbi:hypothetical protein CAAN1_09S05006 [[Candida] anglica]|uniref:Uncharacterized protein n=1 Tax=[Candida] anglica TaxID=148631 RepID=A0ABP0EGJ0_9ASCO
MLPSTKVAFFLISIYHKIYKPDQKSLNKEFRTHQQSTVPLLITHTHIHNMEKSAEEVHTSSTTSHDQEKIAPVEDTHDDYDPNAWYNKKLFGVLPPYSSSMFQVVMLAFVVFMTPGMYNSLSGLGGAGISDKVTADNSTVALYATFATIGFFGGTICNIVGPRACLCFGGTGYALYAGSLLAYQHTANKGFVIFAGCYLGICAGCLWAAQGAIVLSYPTEDKKGTAIMIFWVIFNLGGVIGSIIPLAANMENKSNNATNGTFTGFIVLMASGSLIALLMLPMDKVIKSDGTRVQTQKFPNWKKEIMGLFKLAYSQPMILLMFPMFFSSNWFYTYQFNAVNADRFTIRTRSLNSLLYWTFQMVGAILIGTILDLKMFRRSVRAKIGWALVFVFGMAIFGGLKFQQGVTRENVADIKLIDFKDSGYVGPMFLYIFYGVYDSMYQSYILWCLGAMSNNAQTVALYAGFYKGIQSAGAAVAWRTDAIAIPFIDMFISSWALPVGSLFVAIPLIFFKITDHTEASQDGLVDSEVHDLKSIRSGVESPAIVV